MEDNEDYNAEFKGGILYRLRLTCWCFMVFLSSIFTKKIAVDVSKGYVIYKRELMRRKSHKRRFFHRNQVGE